MRQPIVAHVDDAFAIAHFNLVLIVPFIDVDLTIALLDGDFLVPVFNDFGSIVFDLDRLVVPNFEVVIVLDDPMEILLRVEVDVFRALLILEAKFVELFTRLRPRLG